MFRVMEKNKVLATITREGDRYAVVNHDRRVSSTRDTFKDAGVMRSWLEWAYPDADELREAAK